MKVSIEWHGDELTKAAIQALKEGARITAEVIKGEAVDLCPIESGGTRGSATVTDTDNGATISFDSPQCVWLHEDHSYTPQTPGTGPDYLRNPLDSNADKFAEDCSKAVKAVLGG